MPSHTAVPSAVLAGLCDGLARGPAHSTGLRTGKPPPIHRQTTSHSQANYRQFSSIFPANRRQHTAASLHLAITSQRGGCPRAGWRVPPGHCTGRSASPAMHRPGNLALVVHRDQARSRSLGLQPLILKCSPAARARRGQAQPGETRVTAGSSLSW